MGRHIYSEILAERGAKRQRLVLVNSRPIGFSIKHAEYLCECGNKKILLKSNVNTKNTVSCGCAKKSIPSKYPINVENLRIYRIWRLMNTRCKVKRDFNKRYEGRGIVVCDQWKHDFMSFYNWSINNGYSDELSIDRINNNGNYEPSNCRWATYLQQARNKENYFNEEKQAMLLTYLKERKRSMKEIAKLLNVSKYPIYSYRKKFIENGLINIKTGQHLIPRNAHHTM